jgi:hypothetical protein
MRHFLATHGRCAVGGKLTAEDGGHEVEKEFLQFVERRGKSTWMTNVKNGSDEGRTVLFRGRIVLREILE